MTSELQSFFAATYPKTYESHKLHTKPAESNSKRVTVDKESCQVGQYSEVLSAYNIPVVQSLLYLPFCIYPLLVGHC